MSTARLSGIQLHPIKSLDAVSVAAARIGPAGGLALDRVWSMSTADGRWMNGKRTAAVHGIRAHFTPDLARVRLSSTRVPIAAANMDFPSGTAEASAWFSEYFGVPIVVEYSAGGFPDDQHRNGPMVISTASLDEVCRWFPELTIDEARRRFRTPLEIDGVEAFWEDRLYTASEDDPVPFRIGDVRFAGVNPCPRCVVAARESCTGADLIGFQKRFHELRRAHLPSWAAQSRRFTHFYHLGVNTIVGGSEVGKILRLGDALTIG
jgi:uncharacterized protein YcbX